MQQLLAWLINVLIHLLESAFKKKKKTFGNGSSNNTNQNDKKDRIFDDRHHGTDEALKEAYEFMELTPPCEIEQVKKQFKKLSLRYHPDRGGSNEDMAKLNACLAIVEKDLVQRGGAPSSKGEEDKQDEHGENCYHNNDDDDPVDYREVEREMRRARDEALRQYREKRKEFNQNKKNDKKSCHRMQQNKHLNTERGRQYANESFCRQVQENQRQRQEDREQQQEEKDDGDHFNASADDDEGDTSGYSKPRNPVMDTNVDDLVVALRLDMPDIALNVLHEKLAQFFQLCARQAAHRGERGIQLDGLVVEFLQKPLDWDGNTILHYAVYYEAYQVVSQVCIMAEKVDCLDEIVSQRNQYGLTPWTFADIAKDKAIRRLLQAQLDKVQERRIKTKLFPSLRAAFGRLGQILTNIDWLLILCMALDVYLGRQMFRLHTITTLIAIAYEHLVRDVQEDIELKEGEKQGVIDVTAFWSFCGTWVLLRSTFLFIWQVFMFELFLLLTPFLLVGLCNMRNKYEGMVELLLLPLRLQAYVARYLEGCLQFFYHHAAPAFVQQRDPWARPFLLLTAALITFGAERLH